MKDTTFTHLDTQGNPQMVNVSEKEPTKRTARARAIVELHEAILKHFKQDEIHTKKGPVFQTAILAGIMGAKKTSELIPLCHPLPLEDCNITIRLDQNVVMIESTTVTTGKTGVEIEALTAVSTAALTIYDMCKAFSHAIIIREIKLIEKTGGKQDFKAA